MARLPNFISRVEGKRGYTYEARLSYGPRNARVQLKKRFSTVAEAKAWHAEMVNELASGQHGRRW